MTEPPAGPIEGSVSANPTHARSFVASAGRFLALVSLIGTVAASLLTASSALGYVSSGAFGSGGDLGALFFIASVLGIPVAFIAPVVLGQWALGHRDVQLRGTAAGLGVGVLFGVVAFGALPVVSWLDSLVATRAMDSGIFGIPAAAAYIAYGTVLVLGLLWMVTGRRLRDARVRWALAAMAVSLALLMVSSAYLTDLLERVYRLNEYMADTESLPTTGRYGEPLGGIGPNGIEAALEGNTFLIVPYALGASLGIVLVRKRRVSCLTSSLKRNTWSFCARVYLACT